MASVKRTLAEKGIAPNRRLGQNFLVQPEVARKIASWSAVPDGARVIEVGPGLGALTEALLEKHPVFAIEKDAKLYAHLAAEWKDRPGFSIVHADALEYPFESFPAADAPYYLCSNLPYSVSTPMIEKFIAHKRLFGGITLLLQKELVDRLLAVPATKDYGSLTIFVQTHCAVEGGPVISQGSFHPAPDVDSKLVRLVPRERPLVDEAATGGFSEFVKTMFQFRRKAIRKALEHARGKPAAAFEGKIPPDVLAERIENLPIARIAEIYFALLD